MDKAILSTAFSLQRILIPVPACFPADCQYVLKGTVSYHVFRIGYTGWDKLNTLYGKIGVFFLDVNLIQIRNAQITAAFSPITHDSRHFF